MPSFLKKLRGSLSIGGIWGAAAATISSAYDLLHIGSIGFEQMVENTLTIGVAGFVGGVLFSLALMVGERHGKGSLSGLRGAAWGFLGGLTMPLIMSSVMNRTLDSAWAMILLPDNWPFFLPWALTGALFGAGTAWLAQKGVDREIPEQPQSALESPRPDSPLEQDLAGASTTRPREVL